MNKWVLIFWEYWKNPKLKGLPCFKKTLARRWFFFWRRSQHSCLPNVVWVLDFLNDPQIQFFEILNLFLTFFKEWWLYVRPNPLIFQDQWLWNQRSTLITSRIWCQFWYLHNTCLEWHQPWTENKLYCHHHSFPSSGFH